MTEVKEKKNHSHLVFFLSWLCIRVRLVEVTQLKSKVLKHLLAG